MLCITRRRWYHDRLRLGEVFLGQIVVVDNVGIFGASVRRFA